MARMSTFCWTETVGVVYSAYQLIHPSTCHSIITAVRAYRLLATTFKLERLVVVFLRDQQLD